MSTDNIYFHGEIRKILSGYPSYRSEVCISTWKRAEIGMIIFTTNYKSIISRWSVSFQNG